MPINPKGYLGILDRREKRHESWKEMLSKIVYSFKPTADTQQPTTPLYRYLSETKRIQLLQPQNATIYSLYSHLRRFGLLDHVREHRSNSGKAMIFAQIQDNEAAISAKDNLDPKYGACLARPFNFNNPNYNPFTHCEDCGMEIEKQWKGDHFRICGIQLETSHINNPKNHDTSDINTASTNIAYFSEPKLAKQLPQQPNFNTPTPLIDTALPETINLITLESPPPSHKNPNPLQTPSPNLGLIQPATQKPESDI